MPVVNEGECLSTEVSYDSELQSDEDPGEDNKHELSFSETVSDSLCRNSLVMQTYSFISCPGGWSHLGKKPDVEVLGWRGYTWSECEACWLMVEKLTLHFLATALVDIPAASRPIARSLKT
jgi:hypothetical protein